jgi:hypothetical protein
MSGGVGVEVEMGFKSWTWSEMGWLSVGVESS